MTDTLNPTAQTRLSTIIERIERLEAEKADFGVSIKEVYAEAKGEGFDTGILRKVVALRKLSESARDEMQALIDLYFSAIAGKSAA